MDIRDSLREDSSTRKCDQQPFAAAALLKSQKNL